MYGLLPLQLLLWVRVQESYRLEGAETDPTLPCKQRDTSDLTLQINPDMVLALGDLHMMQAS